MDVTVIVPCFNSEKTLTRCLDSLTNQSIDIKIVVVNDGSTDSTSKIAKEYANLYNNIDVISHDNTGSSKTRKAGLNKAVTKYVAFVDSDDWVDSDMYKRLLDLAENYSADIAVCGITYEYQNKSVACNPKTCENGCITSQEALSYLHKRTGFYTSMCNKLFLTDCIKKASFPEGNFIGEDYAFLLSCLKNANKIAVTNAPLYHYAQNLGSMSKGGFNSTYKLAFDNYKNLYEKKRYEYDEKTQSEMANYLCLEFAAIYVAMIRNSNYDKEVIDYIKQFLKKHLKSLLSEKIDFHFKVSIAIISISPLLFSYMYKPLSKIIK